MVDFQSFVIDCRNIIRTKRTESNSIHLDILDKELPSQDLEGQKIYGSTLLSSELSGKEITEQLIADLRYQLKVAYFLYKRKKARWISLFDHIDSLIEKPVNLDKAKLDVPTAKDDSEKGP